MFAHKKILAFGVLVSALFLTFALIWANDARLAFRRSVSRTPIIGIEGFKLGDVLDPKYEATPSEFGGLCYLDGEYTNVAPFQMLSVYTTTNRVIREVSLMTRQADMDYDLKHDLKESLAAKYGPAEWRNGFGTRFCEYHSEGHTLQLRFDEKPEGIVVSYSDDALSAQVLKDARAQKAAEHKKAFGGL